MIGVEKVNVGVCINKNLHMSNAVQRIKLERTYLCDVRVFLLHREVECCFSIDEFIQISGSVLDY